MKKKINTDALAAELREHSAFFRRPTPQPEQENERTGELPNARTVEDVPERANARPTARRKARRYSFEVYEDQIERIKRRALEDQLRGGSLNQSEIVRDAIDRYFKATDESGE
jgi:hypothetical protein